MKKLIGITGIILIGCVCVSSLYAPKANAAFTAEQTVQAQASSEESFVVKSENNFIVVYRNGESTPYLTTQSRADSLPKSDIMQLKSGIEVVGEKNLRKLLEDYCS